MTNEQTAGKYQVFSHEPLVMSTPAEQVDPKRMDLEYYRPRFVEALARIRESGLSLRPLDGLRDPHRIITDGIRKHTKTESGVVLIRTQNFEDTSLNLTDCIYVDMPQHQAALKSAAHSGDLLIAIRGYLGKAAIVGPNTPTANINQHIARVAVDPRKADSGYLWAFFSSLTGTALLEQQVTGTVQQGIVLPALRELQIPLPPRPVQEYIGAKVRLAERCRTRAQELQKHVEEVLEGVLQFSSFEMPNQKSGSWVEPQRLANRWLNAGFYLPRYLKLLEHLENTGLPIVAISDLATCIRTKKRPRQGMVRYIEIGDIDTSTGRISSWTGYSVEDVPNNAQRLINAKDILVSTRRPTRGAVAVVPDELAGSYTSVFLARMRAKPESSPYYVQQYLRSAVGALFLEQRCSETTYPVISEGDLETVPIPVVDPGVQKDLENSTRAYEELLSISERLVQEAKTDVEVLIEGRLDVDGIVAGRVQPPAWEEVAPA